MGHRNADPGVFGSPAAMTEITIRRPDDWHLHLRDGAMLEGVLADTAPPFRPRHHHAEPRAAGGDRPPMPSAYRERIMAALPDGDRFAPLMTLYLTEGTDPDDVAAGFAQRRWSPPSSSTRPAPRPIPHSGVRDIDKAMPVLERMAEIGMPLCVHGEVTTPAVDIFDREAVFIETVLEPLRRRLPELRIVLEHVTTQDGVDYVAAPRPISPATHHRRIT